MKLGKRKYIKQKELQYSMDSCTYTHASKKLKHYFQKKKTSLRSTTFTPYILYTMKYNVILSQLSPNFSIDPSTMLSMKIIPLFPPQKINKKLSKVSHHTCRFPYLPLFIIISSTHPIS